MQCGVLTTDGYWSGPCNREATTDFEGKLMCASHAGGAKRSKALREKRDEEYRLEQEWQTVLIERLDRLGADLGINILRYYVNYGGRRAHYSDTLAVVPIDWLENIERIREPVPTESAETP